MSSERAGLPSLTSRRCEELAVAGLTNRSGLDSGPSIDNTSKVFYLKRKTIHSKFIGGIIVLEHLMENG